MSVGVEYVHSKQPKVKLRQTAPEFIPKWEGLPLTHSGEDLPTDPPVIIEPDQISCHTESKEPWYRNPKKFFKTASIHLLLIAVLLTYISLSALIVKLIETDTDLQIRRRKVEELLTIYESVANESWDLRLRTNITRADWNSFISAHLYNLSVTHEGEEFPLNISAIETRWTFPSAVLYSTTIITTCGFDRVAVMTDAGKIFSVAFALVGIPLMFITAADIGKLLSELLLFSVNRGQKLVKWAGRCCQRRPDKSSLENRTIGNQVELKLPGDLDAEGSEEQLKQSLWFPIGAYVGMICLYCSLGGLMYTQYERWEFIKSFHFSFNTITTVGLGNIDVVGYIYLALNVAYVICGLSIVTMCIDLASSHLKAYFTELHYFGRPSPIKPFGSDIREMMRLLGTLRKKKGGNVTWEDLKDLLDVDSQNLLRPYAPHCSMAWRYVDETSSAVSTYRQNSVTSELLSSMTSLRKQFYRNDAALAHELI